MDIPANDRQQAMAMLVDHPKPDRLLRHGADHRIEFVRQVRLERLGLGRIFFRMAFARHFPLAAKTTQHLAHPTFVKRLACALLIHA